MPFRQTSQHLDYSLPHTHVHRTVTVLADEQRVCIFDGVTELANHARSYDRRETMSCAAKPICRGIESSGITFSSTSRSEAYLRLRTLPAEQMQCDWAHFGHLRIGRASRPLMGFVDGGACRFATRPETS
jgi:hypothetical protein